MIFALAAPMLIGGGAFMAESGYDLWRHTQLQAVADAAAYAAALELRSGSSSSAITNAAMAAATSNGWRSADGVIEVNTPPSSGAHMVAQAVEVRLSETQPRFLTALFTSEPLVAKTRAVAIYQTGANACVLGLNRTVGKAVQFTGSANVVLDGCDVVSNSIADDGLSVWGSASLSADCVISAGGVEQKGNLTLKGCAAPVAQAPRVADPFKDLAEPTPGNTQSAPKNAKGTTTLSPGSYSSGMDLKGTVNLQPGTYYVSGGDFHVNANAVVSGTGVTIFLAPSSNVSFEGTPTVTMSAPTSGANAGMLFFADPDSTGGSNKFTGNASSKFTGNMYFPNESVEFTGNFGGAGGGCMHVVADTVVWKGSATLKADCAAQGMEEISSQQLVKIVE